MANPKKDTAKTVNDTFDKLKAHFDKKKVDEWQKKWLAMPKNRKKYEKITDAPEVVGEEAVAIVNDIVDFAQGEEGGQSHLFTKVKGTLGGVFGKAKGMADKAKSTAEDAAKTAKAQAEKTTKTAAKKAKSSAGKAKKSVKSAKK
jgi:hypothetical protein